MTSKKPKRKISTVEDIARLREFIDRIEFHAEVKTYKNAITSASLCVIDHPGMRRGVMEVAYHPGKVLADMFHIEHYGFMEMPYVDGDGNKVSSVKSPFAACDSDFNGIFKQILGRETTPEEKTIFSEEFRRKFNKSPAVARFASTLDLEALHTFEYSLSTDQRERAYTLAAGNSPSAMAIKKFGREFPILAALAIHIPALYEATKKGKTAEESYALLMDAFTGGFRISCRDDLREAHTGRLPKELIEFIRGLKFKVVNSGDWAFDLPRIIRGLDLARRLPPENFPQTKASFENFLYVAECVAAFESKEFTLTQMPGRFEFVFSDDELKSMLADTCAEGFTSKPHHISCRQLDIIASYGKSLAGPQDDKTRDLSWNNISQRLQAMRLEDLREALIKDGFREICDRADQYASEQSMPAQAAPSF